MPRVSIQDTQNQVDVDEGEILYDSLFNRGIVLPHGCLSGSCGACRVEILSDPNQLTPPGVVESNTIEALKDEFRTTKGEEFVKKTVIRLSCRAKVIGDVTIQPIK